MKLRHVLLLASAVGACGALLMAMDMFRRVKEAESALLLKGMAAERKPDKADVAPAASRPALPFSQPDATAFSFLTIHAMALVSLAFLFLAIFLLLIAALRDHAFAAALGDAAPPGPPAGSLTPLPPTVVTPLADMARQAEPAAVEPQSAAPVEVIPEQPPASAPAPIAAADIPRAEPEAEPPQPSAEKAGEP